MTKPFIQLHQATKSFHSEPIFQQLDLSLDKGEIMSVVGPSGSGKTTLLRCIAGLEAFTEGHFRINDINVTHKDANKRPVSLVFQQPLLFPHMSILENVAYGLTFQKLKKKDRHERARNLLKQVGLQGYESVFPHELSGGQQQRVSLARSLAIQPHLLLLDEPFSSLDVQLRDEMRTWVRDLLKDQHITALFITHDREEAMYMGDRVGIFHNGSFQQIGEPEDVYKTPANAFVAEFFGDHMVIDDQRYTPIQSLYVSSHQPEEASYTWEGVLKNTLFHYGNRFYQIRLTTLQKTVTVSSALDLSVHSTVYVTADPKHVYSFTDYSLKE